MTKNKKRLLKIIVCSFLFVLAIVIENFVTNNVFVNFCLYFLAFAIVGYNVVINAVKSLTYKFTLDEKFLMTIASVGAFAIGKFAEAVAVMLFYQIGELFQSIAVGKSRESIAQLMNIRPEFARRIVDGDLFEEIDLEEVEKGDILIVRVGEKIPVDAIVIDGSSAVDMSSLNGESIPQSVKVGNSVLGGAVNLVGTLKIKATDIYSNSTVAKILELVETAGEKKSKQEQFITKFAKYYTPIVVGCAVFFALVPPIFFGGWLEWLYKSLNFLVVSCPCALVISVPLSYFGAVGKASNLGILVKGTTFLEQFEKTNVFIFDKTGTLTKGEFEIESIYPENNEQNILNIAGSVEWQSNHPIAKSILKSIDLQKIDKSYVLENVEGKGIKGTKGQEIILAGNAEFMQNNNIKFETCKKVGTTIYIAKNGEFVGYINIIDKVKPNAKRVISRLKQDGAKIIMLTGDNKLMAETVASKLGISEYYHSMLPQNKVQKLEEILNSKNPNSVVAFVGDGINDSPVLMRSDIGVCMGKVGSDSSIEASDVIIMRDNLQKILTIKNISKSTNKIAKQNIFFAIFIKVLVLLLSVLGITGLWLAVFADVGVSVIAILNAMKIFLFKEQ